MFDRFYVCNLKINGGMWLKLYIKELYPVVKHIVSTNSPVTFAQDAHVKLINQTDLVRNILWIDLFV